MGQAQTLTKGHDTTPVTALLLDDDAVDRQRIRRLSRKLTRPLELHDVASIDAMEACLDATSYDIVLIDYGLAQGDGLTALDCVRNHAAHQSAATIMITGNERTSLAVSAMKRGCDDFVSKAELTSDLLGESIDGVLLSRSKPDPMPTVNVADLVRDEINAALTQALSSNEFKWALKQHMRDLVDDASFSLVSGRSADKQETLKEIATNLLEEDQIVFNWDRLTR